MSESDDLTRRIQELEAENRDLKTAAFSSLERSYDITLESLGDALDLKEASTEAHSKRVTAFTIGIAKAMGIPRERIGIIARGAFLHDIGKMAVPDSILRKPDTLTPDETAIMREHCRSGYDMLKKIPFLAEPAEIVYSHHERFDGTGYPRGLRGEQIPLGARIVAVANTLIRSQLTSLISQPGVFKQLAKKFGFGPDANSTLKLSQSFCRCQTRFLKDCAATLITQKPL